MSSEIDPNTGQNNVNSTIDDWTNLGSTTVPVTHGDMPTNSLQRRPYSVDLRDAVEFGKKTLETCKKSGSEKLCEMYQRRYLSPKVPTVLTGILKAGFGTRANTHEAECFRKEANKKIENAAQPIRTKLNLVADVFDRVYSDLEELMSNQHICFERMPTLTGTESTAFVTQGFKRDTAGELVMFIRSTDKSIETVVKALQQDFQKGGEFSELYGRIQTLKNDAPRLNFLPEKIKIRTLDMEQTKNLIKSLEELPSWLTKIRDCYIGLKDIVLISDADLA